MIFSEHIAQLAQYMSSQHHNIRFTYKEENHNMLAFLHVNVYRETERFSSTVHRKDTFSGVYTNFRSFIPDSYKKGLLSTLLYRAFMITSSYSSLHDEVVKLKKIFSKNGYPQKFVDKCIYEFFNKVCGQRAQIPTVPKLEFTMVLPFLGATSLKVKNDLTRSFRQLVPFSTLKVVFKTSKRLSACFTFKDKIPKSLMSGVIYKFTCTECNLSYIGCTKRYWEKRLEEHLHISALTGKPLNGLQVYAPMQHVRSSPYIAGPTKDDFTIIGHEKNPYALQVKESILIISQKPKLNNNQTSVPLHLFSP